MKTFLKIGFLALAVFFSGNLFAQENNETNSDLSNFYNAELFHWSYNMFGGLSLNLYNQSSSTMYGINKSMEDALLSFPDSSREYFSYKQKNTVGNLLTWSGVAMVVLGSFVPMMGRDDNYARNAAISGGAIGGGIISMFIGSFVSSSGQENLFYAVNNYNRNKMQSYR